MPARWADLQNDKAAEEAYPVTIFTLSTEIVEECHSWGDYAGVRAIEQTHEAREGLPRGYQVAGMFVGAGIPAVHEYFQSGFHVCARSKSS